MERAGACTYRRGGTYKILRVTVFRGQILQRHLARLRFVGRRSVGPDPFEGMLGDTRAKAIASFNPREARLVDDPFASIGKATGPAWSEADKILFRTGASGTSGSKSRAGT